MLQRISEYALIATHLPSQYQNYTADKSLLEIVIVSTFYSKVSVLAVITGNWYVTAFPNGHILEMPVSYTTQVLRLSRIKLELSIWKRHVLAISDLPTARTLFGIKNKGEKKKAKYIYLCTWQLYKRKNNNKGTTIREVSVPFQMQVIQFIPLAQAIREHPTKSSLKSRCAS